MYSDVCGAINITWN